MTEKSDEEALAKVWSAVQLFMLARLRLTVSPVPPTTLPEPPTVIEVPVSEEVAVVMTWVPVWLV